MKVLEIHWLGCECGENNVEVTTEKGDQLFLYYGDKARCLSCGATGSIETDDCCAYVAWDEE